MGRQDEYRRSAALRSGSPGGGDGWQRAGRGLDGESGGRNCRLTKSHCRAMRDSNTARLATAAWAPTLSNGVVVSCGVAIVWADIDCRIPPPKRPLASFEYSTPPTPSERELQHGFGPAGCAVLLEARFDRRLDCLNCCDLGGEEGCAADRVWPPPGRARGAVRCGAVRSKNARGSSKGSSDFRGSDRVGTCLSRQGDRASAPGHKTHAAAGAGRRAVAGGVGGRRRL